MYKIDWNKWHDILDELHEEFIDNEWLMNSVYEFEMY